MIPIEKQLWPYLLSVGLALAFCSTVTAVDHFLTIGGGYRPSANQASLEANVLFFQETLKERHQYDRSHTVFFADGYDDKADLQYLEIPDPTTDSPLESLLAQLHRRSTAGKLAYRNHRVPPIAGPISPEHIRASLRRIATQAQPDDRLIIYVTAHGEASKDRDEPFNTYISCWDGQRLSAKELQQWLGEMPRELPIVLVMAQCYCGGFAHIIFQDLDDTQGLSPLRVCGFFAQQHDLPAAGCRPDIENDEEYSSFFWGAFGSKSRNGKMLQDVDCNQDGHISFAEAHAQAVVVSHTIDIPLRTSEVFLRRNSRIAEYEHEGMSFEEEKQEATKLESEEPKLAHSSVAHSLVASEPAPQLRQLSGSVSSLITIASSDVSYAIRGLCEQLGVSVDDEITAIFAGFEDQANGLRDARRSSWRGRRARGSGRRELRAEISEKWPELGDRDAWHQSELLEPARQTEVLEELKQLPSYQVFAEEVAKREQASSERVEAELRQVKFKRLIRLLENVILEDNLKAVAAPEIVDRYAELLSLENQSLENQILSP